MRKVITPGHPRYRPFSVELVDRRFSAPSNPYLCNPHPGATMPMLRPALFLACVALPALAQTPRPLLHGDLQGDKKRGKPFEEVCPVGERLVGLGTNFLERLSTFL